MTASTTPTTSSAATTPHERHVAAYVAGTARSARASVRSNLRRAAEAATGHPLDASAYPWHRCRPDTLVHVRAALADRYAPSTVNASLASVRAVLRVAWLAGDMERDAFERAREALKRVPGASAPGRVLTPPQIVALFEATADGTAAGARDSALLAILYGCGLRTAEVAAATLVDLDAAAETLTVHGKGRRQRLAHPFSNGCGDALTAWLAVRGGEPGPLFAPVDKADRVMFGRGMSGRAIAARLAKRAAQAGITGRVSPHVLRRSFATHVLAAGNDLSVTAALMGHASVATTAIYDRRGEDAKRVAAATLAVPYRA